MDDGATQGGFPHRPSRAASARFAISSTVMEGQTITPDMEELLAEWAAGRLTDEELMRRAAEPTPVAAPASRFAPGG